MLLAVGGGGAGDGEGSGAGPCGLGGVLDDPEVVDGSALVSGDLLEVDVGEVVDLGHSI